MDVNNLVTFKEYLNVPNDEPSKIEKVYHQDFRKIMTRDQYEEACFEKHFLERLE